MKKQKEEEWTETKGKEKVDEVKKETPSKHKVNWLDLDDSSSESDDQEELSPVKESPCDSSETPTPEASCIKCNEGIGFGQKKS